MSDDKYDGPHCGCEDFLAGYARAVQDVLAELRGDGVDHFPREWRILAGDWLERRLRGEDGK